MKLKNLFKKSIITKVVCFTLLLSLIGTLALPNLQSNVMAETEAETFTMDSIPNILGEGTLSGNVITFNTGNWKYVLIPLPQDTDMSKYSKMTMTGSATAKFRFSFWADETPGSNILGNDQWKGYKDGGFTSTYESALSMSGTAKYLALGSCDAATPMVFTIDSIKITKKMVVSEDYTKTKKDVSTNNPISTQRYTADPYAIEYNGRVYVYGTNDSEELIPDEAGKYADNSYGLIKSLNCYSSADMINWTDHGIIKVAGSGGSGPAVWAGNSWAPAVTYKKINGKDKFFIYFANSANSIGVLEGDSPTGPWRDPIGKVLIEKSDALNTNVEWLFDPAVLVDDDGSAYLYFGGGVPKAGATATDEENANPNTARVIKLGADMVSLDGAAVAINPPHLFEDSGINKIGDTYYYSYCTNFGGEWTDKNNQKINNGEIVYMTSKNPMGPFEYQGSILKNPYSFFQIGGNNHHCMLEFKGQLYMFYHARKYAVNQGISAADYRTTYVDKMTVNSDGTLAPAAMTVKGVTAVGNPNPYVINEAESFAWSIGTSTLPGSNPSLSYATNRVVTTVNNGWIGIAGVDFSDGGAKRLSVETSSINNGGTISVYLDNRETGTLVGTIAVPNTGNLNTYQKTSIDITGSLTGKHDLFFVFNNAGIQMDNWKFLKEETTTPIAVTGVSLTKILTMQMKKTVTLNPQIVPSNATNQNVTWTSSRQAIATVYNGKVTAKKPGKTTITVKTQDGQKTATCIVTVKKPVITLNRSSLKIKVKKSNKKVKIKSSQPSGEKIKSAKSSKKSIVSVSVKKGKLTIKGKKKGKSVVTVTSTNGGTARINVNVRK